MNLTSLDGKNHPNRADFSRPDSSQTNHFNTDLRQTTPQSPIGGLLLISMSSRGAAQTLLNGKVKAGNFVSTKSRKGDDLFVTTYIADDEKTTRKAYFRFADGSSVTIKGNEPKCKNFQEFKQYVSRSNPRRSHAELPRSDSRATNTDIDARGSSETEQVILTMSDFDVVPQPTVKESAVAPIDTDAVAPDQDASIQLFLDKLDLTELHNKESMHFRDVTLKHHGFIGFSSKIPLETHLRLDTTGQRCGIHHNGDPELRRLYYSKKESDGSVVVKNIIIDSKGSYISIRDGRRCAPESLTAFLDKEWGRASHR
jgi:hypothetical protein